MAAAVKSKSVMESSSEAMAYDDRLLWGRLWIFFQDMHDEGLVSDREEEYLSNCVDSQDPADPMLAVFLRTGANSYRFLELAMPLMHEKGVLDEGFDRFATGGGNAAAQRRQEAALLSSDEEDVYGDRERPGGGGKGGKKGGGNRGPRGGLDEAEMSEEERRLWREREGLDDGQLQGLDASNLGRDGVGGIGFNPRRVGDTEEMASAPVPPARRSKKPNVMELTPEQTNLPGANHALWLEQATACSVVSSVAGSGQVDACMTLSYQVTPQGSPEPVAQPARNDGAAGGDEPEPPAPPRGVPRGLRAADAGWSKTMALRDLPPPQPVVFQSPSRSSLPRLGPHATSTPAGLAPLSSVVPGHGLGGSALVQHAAVPTPPPEQWNAAGAASSHYAAATNPTYLVAPVTVAPPAAQPLSLTTTSLPLSAPTSDTWSSNDSSNGTAPNSSNGTAPHVHPRVEQWRNSLGMAPERLDRGLVSGLQEQYAGPSAHPTAPSIQSSPSPTSVAPSPLAATPAHSQLTTPRGGLQAWTPQPVQGYQAPTPPQDVQGYAEQQQQYPGMQLAPPPVQIQGYQAFRAEEETASVGEA